jgi:predicted ATPase
MLKKLILENWKSFRYAELYFDPLTVLIGTNASGKSNLVEALEFLRRMATGETVDVALNGDRSLPPIRGGSQEAIFKVNQLSKPKRSFTLKIVVEENNQDYLYTIITAAFSLQIRKEFIEWGFQNKAILNQNDRFYSSQRSCLFTRNFKLSNYDSINGVDSRTVLKNKPNVDIDNYQKLEAVKSDKYPDFYSQLKAVKSDEFINKFSSELRSILIINPLPDRMRDYSKLSENLESDASNIAGVLAALPDEKKLEVESTLSHYLEHFPEGDIKKIWAEKVGRLGTDAMLYCQEEWQPGQITEIDARSMSDGTLRLLGILTALLTRPEGSLIVIEEIDNGLHPSRAELLVKILREIGTKRKIDLLITTHNPALLDALGPEIIPFVTVVHRDAETGESKLTLLEDIENLPKLLATGSLGKLATKGTIEKTLAKSI